MATTTLAAPTPAPKFSIYLDSPESSPLKHKPRAPSVAISSSKPQPILRSRSTSCVNTPSTSWLTCPDKENMHPLTGARSSSIEPAEKTKKRKTSVLETKLYDPPTSKKLKDTKSSKTPSAPLASATNKRRAASVPLPDPDSESAGHDSTITTPTTSSTSQPKKPAKRTAPSRKISSLPKVDEESEESLTPVPTTTDLQTEIDSKCYDLTVSPLADVSDAYIPSDVASATIKPARKSKSIKLEGSAKRTPSNPSNGRPRVVRSASMPASFFSSAPAFEPLTAFALPLLSTEPGTTTPARSISSEDTLVDMYASGCVSPVEAAFKMEAFADVAQPVVNVRSLGEMDTPERARLATMVSFGGVEPMGLGVEAGVVGTIFGSF